MAGWRWTVGESQGCIEPLAEAWAALNLKPQILALRNSKLRTLAPSAALKGRRRVEALEGGDRRP